MRILHANPRGFCAGVRMAIEVVDQTLDSFPGERVYVYHEIVHNRHVVERLRARGAVFVEDIDEVPEGSIAIFSAHGVSPQLRAQAAARRLAVIDATCPLVTKVHSEAIRYARQGYQILLVGHRNHQEVIGTQGEAPTDTLVVERPEDIPSLAIRDAGKLVYLTQTTLSTDDAGVVIAALKRAFPQIKEPPSSDICYATTNRQAAVRQIAPECDLVLVVGSKNSSNSVRLTEIARNVGTPARLLDDASELDWAWFPGADATVLVTAGASAPEELVAGICRALVSRFDGTIETRDIFEEDVEFAAPASMRQLLRRRGKPEPPKGVRLGAGPISAEVYGASGLTISAPPRAGPPGAPPLGS